MPGQSLTGFALPQAQAEYDQETFQRALDFLKDLETAVWLRNTDLEVYSPAGPGGRQPRFILRAPNGAQWSVIVANDTGILSTVVI